METFRGWLKTKYAADEIDAWEFYGEENAEMVWDYQADRIEKLDVLVSELLCDLEEAAEDYEKLAISSRGKINKLEDENVSTRKRAIKLIKRLRSESSGLRKQLRVVTKCVKWVDIYQDRCTEWFLEEKDWCRGCRNKKLLEEE